MSNVSRLIRAIPFTTVGNSQTDFLASSEFGIHADLAARFTILCTSVVATTTFKVQHSTGHGLWTDGKTQAATASTATTVTVSGNVFTATAHGYTQGQLVVLTAATTFPAPLKADTMYNINVIDANTFNLTEGPSGKIMVLTTAGSGTLQTVPVQEVNITYQPNVAGDQAYLPLKPSARMTVTTNGTGTARILRAYYIYLAD